MKAVVLLSGGIDSTTCLALAVDKYGNENVSALNVYYGQRHEREIQSARSVSDFYDVKYTELDLSQVFAWSDCSLIGTDREIEHRSYSEQIKQNGKVDTYVPFRNGVFLSVAASYALSVGADIVMYGAHADDAAGSAYPDCSVKFCQWMADAIREGTGGKIEMIAPFALNTKSDVVGIGIKLKAPYELTWSCYEGGDKPCGKCATCIDRAKAFEKNGLQDPALKSCMQKPTIKNYERNN